MLESVNKVRQVSIPVRCGAADQIRARDQGDSAVQLRESPPGAFERGTLKLQQGRPGGPEANGGDRDAAAGVGGAWRDDGYQCAGHARARDLARWLGDRGGHGADGGGTDPAGTAGGDLDPP
jgi:hypothetical protein